MKHVPIAVSISVKFTLKNKPAKISETSDYSLHVHGAIVQKQDACFFFCCLLESVWCTRTWNANMTVFSRCGFRVEAFPLLVLMAVWHTCKFLIYRCLSVLTLLTIYLQRGESCYDTVNIIHTSLSITAYTLVWRKVSCSAGYKRTVYSSL